MDSINDNINEINFTKSPRPTHLAMSSEEFEKSGFGQSLKDTNWPPKFVDIEWDKPVENNVIVMNEDGTVFIPPGFKHE